MVEATAPDTRAPIEEIAASGQADVRRWLTPSRRSLLLALGVFALLLRLACLTGLAGSDDLGYSKYAHAIAKGTYGDTLDAAERRHHALRYSVLLPVAATYKLFGVSEWSTILVPLLASTLSVVLLAEIGRLMFGIHVGLLAGLLYATFPIQLNMGSTLLPEPIAGCYALIGVLCYLHARTRGGWLWVVAGVMMGAAYLAKESALFIGGAFLLHVLWERRWQGAVLFALGVAAVGAAEHAYYVFWRGDLLFRPHSTQLYKLPETDRFFIPTMWNLWYRLFRKYPELMLVPNVKFGLHSLVCLLGATVALAIRPRKGYVMLLLWAVIPWLYLNFGTWSLTVYAPIPADPRYIEYTYPPLMLLTGIALSRAFASRPLVARSAAALFGVVLTVGLVCGLVTQGTIAKAPEMAVLREIVHAVAARGPDQRIYTDEPRWARALEVFDASLMTASRSSATVILVTDPLGFPAVDPAGPAADGETR